MVLVLVPSSVPLAGMGTRTAQSSVQCVSLMRTCSLSHVQQERKKIDLFKSNPHYIHIKKNDMGVLRWNILSSSLFFSARKSPLPFLQRNSTLLAGTE